MNREIAINNQEAISLLRDFQSKLGKRHSRVHEELLEDASNRIRALRGLCGSCTHERSTMFREDSGKVVVKLHCSAFNDPLELYRNTELGQKAECSDFNESK